MYHYNLQKSALNPSVYIVTSAQNAVLLSCATSPVFTGARLRLPHAIEGTIRNSPESPFSTNKDIQVKITSIKSSEKNLVLNIQNKGPLDVYVKKNDIVAEVTLSDPIIWTYKLRHPDFFDIALFSITCEKLRVQVAHRKRCLNFIDLCEDPAMETSDSILQDILRELIDDDSPMDLEFQQALQGEPVPLEDLAVLEGARQGQGKIYNIIEFKGKEKN